MSGPPGASAAGHAPAGAQSNVGEPGSAAPSAPAASDVQARAIVQQWDHYTPRDNRLAYEVVVSYVNAELRANGYDAAVALARDLGRARGVQQPWPGLPGGSPGLATGRGEPTTSSATPESQDGTEGEGAEQWYDPPTHSPAELAQLIASYRPAREDGRWLLPDRDPGVTEMVFVSYEPSARVHIRQDDETTVGLTPGMVRNWLADQGVAHPKQDVQAAITEYLYGPPGAGPAATGPIDVYAVNEAPRFIAALRHLAYQANLRAQQQVLDAVDDLATLITQQYPPDQFVYVGLGRSPAPVIAALQSTGQAATSIPLSAFRPGPADPGSILGAAFTAPDGEPTPALTAEQQQMLNQHFDEFVGDVPPGQHVLLIDYTESGLSLVAAQYYLQQYAAERFGGGTEIHALALHQDIQTANITATYQRIAAAPRSMPGQFPEGPEVAQQRAQWQQRFTVLSLGPDGALGENGPLLGHALQKESFDNLAEFGSYKILEQDPATFATDRPRRDTGQAGDAATGYAVLGNAVRENRESGFAEIGDDQLPIRSHAEMLPAADHGLVVGGIFDGRARALFLDGQWRDAVETAAWIQRWTPWSPDEALPVILIGGGAGMPEFAAAAAAILRAPVIAAGGSVLHTPDGQFHAGTAVTGTDGQPALISHGDDGWNVFLPDGPAHPLGPDLDSVATSLGIGLHPPQRNPRVPTLWNRNVPVALRPASALDVYPAEPIPPEIWQSAVVVAQRWNHYPPIIGTDPASAAQRHQQHQAIYAVARRLMGDGSTPPANGAQASAAGQPGRATGLLGGARSGSGASGPRPAPADGQQPPDVQAGHSLRPAFFGPEPAPAREAGTGLAGAASSRVIGFEGVAYPGPSRLRGNENAADPIYRGEFEVEFKGTKEFVRIYMGIVNPENIATEPNQPRLGKSRYKDVQQDQATKILTFSGGEQEMLWVGGGRPLRAVQWLKKYEVQFAGKPERPVLRSFLVPLDDYLKITNGLASEKRSAQDPNRSFNVDQRGEPNQIGLRGSQFKQLVAAAEPDSLITYATDPVSIPRRELAGVARPVAELYHRLGIDAFQSDVLGKQYDPWFSWKQDNGTWTANFRNDPDVLHRMARDLREHWVTWQQWKQPASMRQPNALLDSDVEGWLGKKAELAPGDSSLAARIGRLNGFLNTVGPPSPMVQEIVANIARGGGDAAADYLSREAIPAPDKEAAETVLADVLAKEVLPAAAAEFIRETRAQFNIKSEEEFQSVLKDGKKFKKGGVKKFPVVLPKVKEKFEAEVVANPRLELVPGGVRGALAEAMWPVVQASFEEAARKFADWKTGDKKGWRARLGGRLAGEVTRDQAVKQSIKTEATNLSNASVDKASLGQIITHKVIPEVEEASAAALRERPLFTMNPKDIRATVENDLVPRLVSAYSDKLSGSPLLSLLPESFRSDLAKHVASTAHVRAAAEIATLAVPSVKAAEIEAFMSAVPQAASQAAIGALIAADYERLRQDANVREVDPETVDADPALGPFLNDFAAWHAERQNNEDRQRDAGQSLASLLADLPAQDGTPQEIAERLVKELLAKFPELKPKFAEISAVTENLTFYDHAQLVLGQFLTLTRGEEDSGRLVSRDTMVKAILFHDLEKIASRKLYGAEKTQHDREPEHKLAVDAIGRYPALWTRYTDFLAARALVDADPIGFYLRQMHDADTAFSYIVDWAYRLRVAGQAEVPAEHTSAYTQFEREREAAEMALGQAGRRPNADLSGDQLSGLRDDIRRFFVEFHQYYQADFSSYTPAASYRKDGEAEPRYAPNRNFAKSFVATQGEVTANGAELQRDKDGRTFSYAEEYAERFAELANMFATEEQIIVHYARIRQAEQEKITAGLAGPALITSGGWFRRDRGTPKRGLERS